MCAPAQRSHACITRTSKLVSPPAPLPPHASGHARRVPASARLPPIFSGVRRGHGHSSMRSDGDAMRRAPPPASSAGRAAYRRRALTSVDAQRGENDDGNNSPYPILSHVEMTISLLFLFHHLTLEVGGRARRALYPRPPPRVTQSSVTRLTADTHAQSEHRA